MHVIVTYTMSTSSQIKNLLQFKNPHKANMIVLNDPINTTVLRTKYKAKISSW